MSIEAFHSVRRSAILALWIAALGPTASAAEVDFRPVLSFGAFYSGNVLLVGVPEGDEIAAVALNLDLDRKLPGSTFSFRYQPAYVWYRQYSEFNYLGNTVALSYAKERSRRSGMSASLDASRTDFQGITASNSNRPNTIVPRTTITRVYALVGGSEAVAQRSLMDWQVRAEVHRYKDVPDVVFDNSSAIGARGGWRYELSERSSLGLALTLDRFAYDLQANVIDAALLLTGTYKLGRSTEMQYDVGVTHAKSGGLSRTDGAFRVSFTQALTDVSRLNAGASQSITQGTGLQASPTQESGLQASTLDSGAWISYEGSQRGRGLHGRVDGAYWYRSGLGAGHISTLNFSSSLGWTFNRYVSLSAAYAYVRQSVKTDTPSALNTYYPSYGINLRWAIRGR